MFPAHASDVYFLTRDGDRIELSTPLKNTLSTKIISKSNRIESKNMPSAFFYPLGTFIMSGEEYSFCLFHVQSKKQDIIITSLKYYLETGIPSYVK